MSDKPTEEYLLKVNPNRYTLFPIKHKDIWGLVKKHQSSLWTAQELDFSADLECWKRLNNDEQHFIKMIIAFFAGSDGIVLENLNINFASEIQLPEVRYFYSVQGYIENVHSEVYSTLIDTYIEDSKEKTKLFNAIETIPCIQRKAKWAQKWMTNDQPFTKRLLAFVAVEGIFFSGSFTAIDWFGYQNKMTNGLVTSNEWISRDEGLHVEFAVLLYRAYATHKLAQEEVHELFKEAVDCEDEFINVAVPCTLIGMNPKLMTQSIQFICDRIMIMLGYEKIYNVENPFPFLENRNLQGKTNFFEKRVTDYNVAKSNENGGDEFEECDV